MLFWFLFVCIYVLFLTTSVLLEKYVFGKYTNTFVVSGVKRTFGNHGRRK